ncbi:hypothetical protein V9T40_004635 [Parthenolecanium corni]|uniref:Uncharacterized protein n=1 Tax=Parthenolecanium corni TaxID=536013 RepID=A0AAN9TCL9_9HEMI
MNDEKGRDGEREAAEVAVIRPSAAAAAAVVVTSKIIRAISSNSGLLLDQPSVREVDDQREEPPPQPQPQPSPPNEQMVAAEGVFWDVNNVLRTPYSVIRTRGCVFAARNIEIYRDATPFMEIEKLMPVISWTGKGTQTVGSTRLTAVDSFDDFENRIGNRLGRSRRASNFNTERRRVPRNMRRVASRRVESSARTSRYGVCNNERAFRFPPLRLDAMPQWHPAHFASGHKIQATNGL